MTEYAPERRCPFFLICREAIPMHESECPMIVPAYKCDLVSHEMARRAGPPCVAYGLDDRPVSPQTCTLQRYETECKGCLRETAPTHSGVTGNPGMLSGEPVNEPVANENTNPSGRPGSGWVRVLLKPIRRSTWRQRALPGRDRP
jgi:hypothetical protein